MDVATIMSVERIMPLPQEPHAVLPCAAEVDMNVGVTHHASITETAGSAVSRRVTESLAVPVRMRVAMELQPLSEWRFSDICVSVARGHYCPYLLPPRSTLLFPLSGTSGRFSVQPGFTLGLRSDAHSHRGRLTFYVRVETNIRVTCNSRIFRNLNTRFYQTNPSVPSAAWSLRGSDPTLAA
jgi:hypothetical protein